MIKRSWSLHQSVWLAAHPQFSESWLTARLAEGFHVHHIDENRMNNGPSNLALVFGTDHSRIHTHMRKLKNGHAVQSQNTMQFPGRCVG